MKANAPAARNSPATGEQNTETQQRVTARSVADETGEVETIYRVDGRRVHRVAVLHVHRRCRRCLGESVGHIEGLDEWFVDAWELLGHSPEYQFTRRPPVDYDPDAEPEATDEFMTTSCTGVRTSGRCTRCPAPLCPARWLRNRVACCVSGTMLRRALSSAVSLLHPRRLA
jgi:hypothetical protein